MWIRSQDRLRLLNLNGFNYLNENNEHKILGFDTSSDNDDMYWLLGEYSTKEKIDCVEEIIKYIDNDLSISPYEFKDLKVGMWVYDTKPTFEDFRFIKITKILSKEDCKYLYNDENLQVFFDNQIEHARDFEEGRYFPITKAMEEFEDDN